MINVSIDINLRNESIKSGDQIIKICKCLVLVYDGGQSIGKLYLHLDVCFLITLS